MDCTHALSNCGAESCAECKERVTVKRNMRGTVLGWKGTDPVRLWNNYGTVMEHPIRS